ncbi:unnamed protein product [Mytilus edulis]|uniref:Ig-like domain-containing protein n=1 Tax=Mytilus edulis TaxID=6550 RepID=A0A8S3R1F5_MYTED|nr:unnamed protein product [Mytilus edulis]
MKLECLEKSNPPKTNISWVKDGVILSSDPSFEKTNMKTKDSGNYSCIVFNSLGGELEYIVVFVNSSNGKYNDYNLEVKKYLYFGILTLSCVLLVTSVICNICIHLHCKKLSRVPLQTGNNEVSVLNIEMTAINNGYHTINEEDIIQEGNEVENQAEIQSTYNSSSVDSDDKSAESATNENEPRESNDYLNPYCAVVESIADVHNYESLSLDKFELNMTDVDLNTGIQRSYENLKF